MMSSKTISAEYDVYELHKTLTEVQCGSEPVLAVVFTITADLRSAEFARVNVTRLIVRTTEK